VDSTTNFESRGLAETDITIHPGHFYIHPVPKEMNNFLVITVYENVQRFFP
jgi:hypothetical protein